MTFEEKVAMANTMRSRSRVGPVSPEELAVLPGTEKELWIEVADGRKVHLFEERPDALPENAALLLNFHGGGFIKGRTDRDRRYCCTLMEQLNCLVWDVDYCLAPEQAFPAAVEETYGIIAYASEHAPELGIDPQKILLAGHSAGGNLVAAALIKDAEIHRLHPCCALLEYFPVDNTVDPIDRLSPELRADPFWVKRAHRLLCRGCRPRRSAVFPAQGGRDCAGRFPGLPDPLRRGGQPAERHRGVRAPAHQGRDLRDSTAHPGSNARVHDQPHPRLGARTGSTLQIFPTAFIILIT